MLSIPIWSWRKPGLYIILSFTATALLTGCAPSPVVTPAALSEKALLCVEGWECSYGPLDTPIPGAADKSNAPSKSPTSGLRDQAVLGNIQGHVTVRGATGVDPAPARNGATLWTEGTLQTDQDARARITFQPEGSVINIGPDSNLTLKEITLHPDGQPVLRFQLGSGQIWILPRHGALVTVKTNAGTAVSQGSPMSVSYDANANTVQASCLQGICSLQNDEGEIFLTDSMMAVFEHGKIPYSYEQMSGDLFQQWVNENTDLKDYFGGRLPEWLPPPN